ncbi:hypothetical protein PFICI_01422 [Pestalotiopsis fici W106-1]|uniref:Golgi apparatus membrane protein TVP38 n=1 Tax=Pestalotiopsis fici (strain W106-1 / CGMCC3.15140) TaxID=1229662 RepID=W3XNN9_PESFW|nr:uncharacterized protein PFICI_01422 [Pestalotiopsis fici W106-1]ETS87594.1 hypothetical protein PFICI_01422 [Pestalotiopsis fici W106-1]
MPADYKSAARNLSMPISPGSEPSTPSPGSTSPSSFPSWARRDQAQRQTSSPHQQQQQQQSSNSRARRLSRPYSRSSQQTDGSSHLPLGARLLRTSTTLMNRGIRLVERLSPLQRVLAAVAGLVMLVLTVLFLVYSHRIFGALKPVAEGWRDLRGGWIIVWLMTFATAFPPVIGYSSTITVAGFVFGFPGGWPIVASATVAGSAVAFLTSRTIFSGYVDRLVGADRRFVALGQVLRHDGLLVLAGIRFCPLPYSLSNGFLATIPNINPLRFAAATALATPKLLVHVFIGSRLAQLAEDDDMSTGDKVINYLSMLVGGLLGMGIGLFVYRRTMARAEELAREEAGEDGPLAGDVDYEDLEEGVLQNHGGSPRGESDAAALMDDDDISLWETDAMDDGYRDDEQDDTNNGIRK